MDTTIINKFGKMTGWNSVTVNMLARDVEGISAIKYTDNVNKENVYGAGKYPVGRSEGNYETDVSISLYKEEVDGILKAIPPGSRIQDIAPFDITVEYEGPNGRIMKDRIRNAEFLDNGVEVKNGDGSISREYPLIVSHIEWNVI